MRPQGPLGGSFMRCLLVTCLLASLSAAVCSDLHARQRAVRQATILCVISKVCDLGIASDFIWSFMEDGSGEVAFEQGYTESAPDQTTLTISTNASWHLDVGAGSWTCPPGYDKAEGDLLVRISNRPIGTIQNGYEDYRSPPPLASREAMIEHGEGVEGNKVELQYRVLLDWERDIPGSYSINVTYTLSTGTFQ